jgi:putative nucleotidyltransferase with HDIG domain/PAS domain S-box-containing protein
MADDIKQPGKPRAASAFLFIRKSLALYITGLIVLLVLLTSLSYYYVQEHERQEFLNIQETTKDKDIRFVIHSLVNKEIERLSALSNSLKEREDFIVSIAVSSASAEEVGPIKEVMDRLLTQLGLDILQVTDQDGNVIYNVQSPEARGEAADYSGLAQTLRGEDTLLVSECEGGWAIRAAVPAYLGRELVGAIMIGTVIDDDFATGFARATDSELTFATADGIVASSLPAEQRGHIESEMVRKSLEDGKPLRRRYPNTTTAVNYAPVRVAGEVFSLVVEFDSGEIISLYEEDNKEHLQLVGYIIIAAIILGSGLTMYLVAPLKRLREKAEDTVREITGKEITHHKGDEVQSLVRSFDLMVEGIKTHLEERKRAEENLQSHIKKLEDYTVELEKADKVILQSRQDWEETFNTITDMITIHDRDFNITRMNKSAEEILGPSGLEGSKIKCFRHFHGTETPKEACPGLDCFSKEEPFTVELFEPHLDRFLEIRTIPRLDERKDVVGIIHVARDITKRKHIEKRIERQLERLSALRTIDRAISASPDLRLTLDVFIEQAIFQLDVDAADVLLLNPHSRFLDYASGRGFRTKRIENVSLRLGVGLAGQVALKRKALKVADIDEYEEKATSEFDYKFSQSYLIMEEGFKAYFAIPLIVKGSVIGVFEIFNRAPFRPDDEWFDFLEALAGQVAIAVDNAVLFENLQRSSDELVLAYDTTIEGWAKALDFRDRETEGHSRRVTDITLKMARTIGMKDDELVHVRRGALLHDIGKMGVPDRILLKSGKLTDEEWDIMKRHPEIALELLSPITFLRPAIDIPYCHHERWDGTGYPRGLKQEQIPLSARIFAVVDVWDALRSDRPYRPSWPEDKTREHILSESGSHFDPEVVKAFF